MAWAVPPVRLTVAKPPALVPVVTDGALVQESSSVVRPSASVAVVCGVPPEAGMVVTLSPV